MGYFSHVWERMKGNARSGKPAKSLKNRSLRMESLEDRALLSVTTAPVGGAVPEEVCVSTVVSTVLDSSVKDACLSTDVPIPLLAEAGEDTAGSTAAASNDVVANNLPAPTNFTSSLLGYSVTLTWDSVDGAAGYTVRYREDSGDWVEKSSSETSFYYRYSGYSPLGRETPTGTAEFQVKANGDGQTTSDSDWSDTLSATLPVQVKLEAPTNFKVVEVRGYEVTFAWDEVSGAGSYTIQYRQKAKSPNGQGQEAEWERFAWADGWATVITAEFQDAEAGTYEFRIMTNAGQYLGYNPYLSSDYSDPVEAYAPVPIQLATPEITGVEATGGYNVTVTWNPVGHAEQYIIAVRKEGSQLMPSPIYVTGTSYTFVDTDFLGPGNYTIDVRAMPSEYESDVYLRSDSACTALIELPAQTKLDPPENLEAYLLDDVTAMVEWSPVTDAAGYTLRYKKIGEEEWGGVVTGLTDTSYQFALEKDTTYLIEVKAESAVSQDYDSDFVQTSVASGLSPWDLANWGSYTNFEIDVDLDGMGYLYGVSKDGTKEALIDADRYVAGRTLTVYSDNTARTVKVTENALYSLGGLVYIGGKTKNDTIILEGSDLLSERFMFSQRIAEVEVHERPGNTPKEREVTFDTIAVNVAKEENGVEANEQHYRKNAVLAFSGVRTLSLDAGDGNDAFIFTDKLGATYNITAGAGVDTLDFSEAPTGVKVDMGKTKAQSVLSGKITLNGDIESIVGSRFKDTITTAANTLGVNMPAGDAQAAEAAAANWVVYSSTTGSDTIKLVGDVRTRTSVFLSGDSQKVTCKGGGQYTVNIYNGSKSTVNMSSLKAGSLQLYAEGNKIKVTGSKGADNITIIGDDADVKGGDGDDYIKIEGVNAKARGDKGNDMLDLSATGGTNTLEAGAGDDVLVGGRGSDTLKGQSGNNVLIGNAGTDKFIGGKGSDLMIANSTERLDTWTGDMIKAYYTLGDLWRNGSREEVLGFLGDISVSDRAKDSLKRGGGEDNVFYANPVTDFDTIEYKADKGDIVIDDARDKELLLYDPLDTVVPEDAASEAASSVEAAAGAPELDSPLPEYQAGAAKKAADRTQGR